MQRLIGAFHRQRRLPTSARGSMPCGAGCSWGGAQLPCSSPCRSACLGSAAAPPLRDASARVKGVLRRDLPLRAPGA